MCAHSKFLEDVGMNNLPFPMSVNSKGNPNGQPTVANISISARVLHDFEASWIDKFMHVLHQHKDRIGPKTLKANILDYLKELQANEVKVDFDYPYFVEKTTPVSKEKCLVRYNCTYSAKVTQTNGGGTVVFKMEVPAITTYPVSGPDKPGGLFGQLSLVTVEIASEKDIFPEDVAELVDRSAVAPLYSFMSKEDQEHMIEKIHSKEKTSVEMVDDIKRELAGDRDISWYSVKSANYGLLHSYSTLISIEKSAWVPFSGE